MHHEQEHVVTTLIQTHKRQLPHGFLQEDNQGADANVVEQMGGATAAGLASCLRVQFRDAASQTTTTSDSRILSSAVLGGTAAQALLKETVSAHMKNRTSENGRCPAFASCCVQIASHPASEATGVEGHEPVGRKARQRAKRRRVKPAYLAAAL